MWADLLLRYTVCTLLIKGLFVIAGEDTHLLCMRANVNNQSRCVQKEVIAIIRLQCNINHIIMDLY